MNVYALATNFYIPFFALPYIAIEIYRIRMERPLRVSTRLIQAACVLLVGHFLLLANIFLSGVTIMGLIMVMNLVASTLSLLSNLSNFDNILTEKIIKGCLFGIVALLMIGWLGLVVKGNFPLWLIIVSACFIFLITMWFREINDISKKNPLHIKNGLIQLSIISTLIPSILGVRSLILLIQRKTNINLENIFWDFLTNNFQSLYNQV